MAVEVLEIKAKVIVGDEEIDDIMESALLGVRYWCDTVKIYEDKLAVKHMYQQISKGGLLAFHTEEPFEDSGKEWYTLNKKKFMKGLKMYLDDPLWDCLTQDGGTRFLVDPGCIDGECADAIVQYALFGEIVYG